MEFYYVGLLVLVITGHAKSFLPVATGTKVDRVWELVLVPYIALSGYLFGWKIALLNVGLVSLLGSLLDYPIERLGKRLFPSAVYRGDLSPELKAQLRKIRLWLGINRSKP